MFDKYETFALPIVLPKPLSLSDQFRFYSTTCEVMIAYQMQPSLAQGPLDTRPIGHCMDSAPLKQTPENDAFRLPFREVV